MEGWLRTTSSCLSIVQVKQSSEVNLVFSVVLSHMGSSLCCISVCYLNSWFSHQPYAISIYSLSVDWHFCKSMMSMASMDRRVTVSVLAFWVTDTNRKCGQEALFGYKFYWTLLKWGHCFLRLKGITSKQVSGPLRPWVHSVFSLMVSPFSEFQWSIRPWAQ